MARVKLSAPWVQYYCKLDALFEKDQEVKIVYDEEETDIKKSGEYYTYPVTACIK